jgi:two-component system, chemotaxis family, chemotaxis protein CheY
MVKILIVDDSGLSRKMLCRILEPAGYDIIEASDGQEALDRYVLDQPDLVLLDLVMAGLDGWEVLDKLRELDADARVVVATADIQTSTREMTLSSGAFGLVTKPFQPEQVLEVVREALNTPKRLSRGGPISC